MVYNPRQVYKYRKRFKYKLDYKLPVRNKSYRINAASIAIKSLTLTWLVPKQIQFLHLKVKQKFKFLKKKKRISRRKKLRFKQLCLGKGKHSAVLTLSRQKLFKLRRKYRKRRLGWVTAHLCAYCPVTRKSKLVRMGKGKGKFRGWKAPVFMGSVLFQIRRNGLNSIIKNLKIMFRLGKLRGRFSGRLKLIIVRNIY